MMNDVLFQLLKIPAHDVVFIFLHAHPDDESFLTAGLMHRLVSEKREVQVIFLATGLHPKIPKTQIRIKEAKAACKIVGKLQPTFLNYFEPKYFHIVGNKTLQSQKTEALAREIYSRVKKMRKGRQVVLFSYDVNGGYGNPDHKKLHAIGNHLQTLDQKIAVFESTINRTKFKHWLRNNKTLSPNKLPQLSYWQKKFGHPEKEIQYVYILSTTELEIKKQAMRAHASQILHDHFPLSLSKNNFKHLFGAEYYKVSTKSTRRGPYYSERINVLPYTFASAYPLYITKAEKKGRTKDEVDTIVRWLTGYTQKKLETQIKKQVSFETFFAQAPKMNPNRKLITGVICGIRVENITEPLMQEIRYLDKLIDELAKGRPLEKILRAK